MKFLIPPTIEDLLQMNADLIRLFKSQLKVLRDASPFNAKERANMALETVEKIFDHQARVNNAVHDAIKKGMAHRIEMNDALHKLDQILIIEGVKPGHVDLEFSASYEKQKLELVADND